MKSSNNILIGKHALQEVLKYQPQRLQRVFTAKQDGPLFEELNQRGIHAKFVSKQYLTRLAGTDSHQSFVAYLKPRPKIELKQFLESMRQKDKSRLLLLDSITDPHNIGAILRSAECFGADAVIWSRNRSPNITPVMIKSSAGASELIPIIIIANLAQSVDVCKDFDYTIMTAEADKKAQIFEKFSFPQHGVLILGAEGKGVQPLLSKKADHKLYIPLSGKISSLNVSQAAAVILSRWH